MAEDAQTEQPDQTAGQDPSNEGAPYPPSLALEERVAILEEDLRGIKAALYAIPGALEKEKLEIKKNLEAFEGIQSGFKELSDTAAKSYRSVNTLEKRVDGVKRSATSGVVASILIFSIMLIISLFIRTP